jgi:hypothetical protein
MAELIVLQSLWAMERRHTDGVERSLEQNLAMIMRAGFGGVSAHCTDREHVKRIVSVLGDEKFAIEGQVFPKTVDDLKPVLDIASEFAVDHINLQPDVRPRRLEDCFPLIEGWQRLGEEAGIPIYVETHRDRMTTDLYFVLDLLDRYPELKLIADLSHILVGREFAWPVSEENHALVHQILDASWRSTAASPHGNRCRSKSRSHITSLGSICSCDGGITAFEVSVSAPDIMRPYTSRANSARSRTRSLPLMEMIRLIVGRSLS